MTTRCGSGRRSEVLNRQLEQLNAELSRKMREIEELQARLKLEAVHDPLTQLFNRRYLDSAMPGLIGSSERWNTPLTLALLDLDHFKRVNDRHGHLAGDKVLRRIGKLFGTSLRPSDIVARWGGEEFCIVFPETDVAGAATALASLAAKLRMLEVEWGDEFIGGFTFSAALACARPARAHARRARRFGRPGAVCGQGRRPRSRACGAGLARARRPRAEADAMLDS